MAEYIDGFTFPIARDRLDEYRALVAAVAEIWREHGALEYREYMLDAAEHEGLRSFVDTVEASEEEVVVFGWVVFADKDARYAANEKVATDPRMVALSEKDAGFDEARMIYGGFSQLTSA